jgi:hypothetical protein
MYLILAAIFLLSVAISVLADRFSSSDKLARVFFGFSFLPLFFLIIFVVYDLVLASAPLDLGLVDSFKWSASKFGGWSPFIAVQYFCGAAAFGVLFGLSWFINDVETEFYGFVALFGLINGIVFLVGFLVFFEALALILGIIATIITIILGVKKLSSSKAD